MPRKRPKRSRKAQTYDGKGAAATGLTSPELITQRLQGGLDPGWRDSVYQQMRYAFGESWNESAPSGYGEHFNSMPDYPDIVVRYAEVGRSRRMATSQLIGLARTMSADLSPEFGGVDEYTAEVRKQFFVSRYMGDESGEYAWSEEFENVFMDGDGMGQGFLQVCLRTNPETGRQLVSVRHSPLVQTFWDRHQRGPSHARWVAFCRYMALEDAADFFGEEIALANVRTMFDGRHAYGLQVVRFFEYYDIGVGGRKPTTAFILNDINNAPHSVQENTFGCLPFAYYYHVFQPGMQRPIGRIALTMPAQQTLNELERKIRQSTKRQGATVVDVDQIDEEDLEAYNAGETFKLLRWNSKQGDGRPPIQNVEGLEVTDTTLKLYQIFDQQFTSASGVTDFDQGVQPHSDRTLGEDELVDRRGQTQASRSELQTARFLEGAVKKILRIAALFDEDPLEIEVFGKVYTLNEAARPASMISKWLERPASVTINVNSLRYQDEEQTRALRLNQLLAVKDQVGRIIDPAAYAEEIAKALGEKDPKKFIIAALLHPSSQAPPIPQMPGQPGMGAPGMPPQAFAQQQPISVPQGQ